MTATLIAALLILSTDATAPTEHLTAEAVEVFSATFEDENDANYDGWPDDWTRRRDSGYPVYLPIEIVPDINPLPNSTACLRLQLDGGAAQIFSPRIDVSPLYSYQLTGYLRTQGLKHNVASMIVTFLDGEGRAVEVHESSRITKADAWTRVSIGPITLTSDQVRAAIVSVHLRPTNEADLAGYVEVDDLWFGRLPKMSMTTNSEGNLFTKRDGVAVTCRMSGFSKDNPVMTFELFDVTGQLKQKHEQAMTADKEQIKARNARAATTLSLLDSGFTGQATWKPKIDSYGFYRIRVSTPGNSGLTLDEEVSLIVMPPLQKQGTGEFGWSFPAADEQVSIKALPTLVNHAGLGWIKFPVWFSSKDRARADALAWFAERLSAYNIRLIGVLDQPPADIRQMYDSGDRVAIASVFSDRNVWFPALDPVLTRLSLKVHWWQLGRDDDTSFVNHQNLSEKLATIREGVSSFGQQVNLGVSWPWLEDSQQIGDHAWSFVSYSQDPPLTERELTTYLQEAKGGNIRCVNIQPLDEKFYSLDVRAKDLIFRMLAAKMANAKGIFVPDPFHSASGLMHQDGSPKELFLPWRTTASLVGGGLYLGSIRLPNGSYNQLFQHGENSVMAVWSEHPTTETLYLGNDVHIVDIWGNASRPKEETDGEFLRQVIPVGPTPTFVIGVNSFVAKWRMFFRFEQDRLASLLGRDQVVAFHFNNPFPQGVGGRLKVHTPAEWKVDTSDRQFKVGDAETWNDAIRVQLGPETKSGPQKVRVDFELTADRSYKFSAYETLHVGLGDVLIELETRLDEFGNLIVQQHLINNTDRFVSFNCLLFPPNRRRERRQVFNLGRGRTTNTFILPNGQELLGETLWMRAEEIGGARILNDSIVASE